MDKLKVGENVAGTWTYHLYKPGEKKAICGTKIMETKLDGSDWQIYRPDHIPVSYCQDCNKQLIDNIADYELKCSVDAETAEERSASVTWTLSSEDFEYDEEERQKIKDSLPDGQKLPEEQIREELDQWVLEKIIEGDYDES